MPNPVTINLSVIVNKGKFRDPFQPGSIGMTLSTTDAHRPIVTVNTSAYEAVPFGDIGTPRLMYGRSLDGTNYVSIGMSTAAGSTVVTPFGKIEAGHPFCFGLAAGVSTLLKWKANAAAVKIDHRALGT